MKRYAFSPEQRALLEGLAQPMGIYQFIDMRVVTLVLSDGFCKLFGYNDRDEAYLDMDTDMYKDAHPDDVARIADAAFRFATEDVPFEVIYRTRVHDSSNGEYRIIHAMGEHVFAPDGTRLAHVWYTDEGAFAERGNSQRAELNRAFTGALREESLVRESRYDFLTGLPSIHYFFDLVEEGSRAIRERGEVPVMLFMDLNGMKFYNGRFGFAAGNELLREFARVLRSTFSAENCCRFGADHFAAFTTADDVQDTIDQLFDDVRGLCDGNALPVRVGVYSAAMGDVSVSTACDRAKLACDSLRDSYSSCVCYFDEAMLAQSERRRHVLDNFDRALEEGWIQVYYQPIMRASNGQVCDEEALARWVDPELGILPPCDFIPTLEDCGVIYRLDLYVLDRVLESMATKQKAGLEVVPCSINLSRNDFAAVDMVEEVARRVEAAGVDSNRITIEMTESTVGGNPEYMQMQVRRFREQGFRVWMDDFGSGYSSVDLLQSVEFDLVKFDMSFMRQFDEGEGAKIVLTQLIKMATALGIDTLCEGVETREQMRFLQEAGCSRLQGYLFSKPVPLESVLAWPNEDDGLRFENPEDAPYFDAIDRVSLYDLSPIIRGHKGIRARMDALPMCVMEIVGERGRYVRTNQSWRDHVLEHTGRDMTEEDADSMEFKPTENLLKVVLNCAQGGHSFVHDTMADGATSYSLVRHVGTSPVTGNHAVAIAVLSVTE